MTDSKFVITDDMTVAQAREIMREAIREGRSCPCCNQMAKIYRRPIHKTMATELVQLARATKVGEYGYLPDVLGTKGGDVAKLRYWGLIEPEAQRSPRDDGSDRAGYWRVTPKGRDWARGQTEVAKYAEVYAGDLLGLTGDPVSIRDVLGTQFRYDTLMAERPSGDTAKALPSPRPVAATLPEVDLFGEPVGQPKPHKPGNALVDG